eukprot:Seg1448.3 transcript_id=Seg1448.3/GoldUCD/mRNA.D3Y31 product="hypothetical protein" protein_id=Seg1448.3/GoldUCD/D3Y31
MRLVNDQLYSREALSEVPFKDRFRREMPKDTKMSVYSTETSSVKTNRVYESKSSCPSCEGLHDLDRCSDYLKLDVKERSKFLYVKRLCYARYKPTSPTHVSKSCNQRRTCNICAGSHPTGLHGFKFAKRSENDETKRDDVVCNLTFLDAQVISLSVIPVKLGVKGGNQELVVYAMLDNCSQGTFIHEDILDALKMKGVETTITVKTMTGEDTEGSVCLDNLTVSGLGPAERETISLPKTYCRRGLPIQRDDIPTPHILRHWPHLREIMKDVHKEDSEIPIGLLIGANCPLALEPHEIIPSQDGGPYAFRSCLGWCISGPIIKCVENGKAVRCNRITVTDAGSAKIADHHCVVEDTVKDVTTNEMLKKMYHTDFSETKLDDGKLDFPQEDKKFLKMMKEQSIKADGHYVLPLPFRNPNVYMPNNKEQAMKRAVWTKRRLQKDPKFYSDYVKFMTDIISKGYAKQVEENCDIPGKQWYIPHHGVYHPKKPEKIRVVFDCSTQYKGSCLNKELLQGPDLTNQLVGVLLRFRKELIAFTGDIGAMFYQVRVPEDQRSYLRFLWWPERNLEAEPIDYEMCVHLFGGISSPSCSNFALRRTADDLEEEFGREAAMTLKRNFYVDEMLKSKECSSSSIALISNICKMCASGGFNLIKLPLTIKKCWNLFHKKKDQKK